MSRTSRVITLLLCITATSAHADWKSLIEQLPESAKAVVSASDAADVAGLSTAEMTAGLKEALNTGTEIAVNELGREGGFLDNPQMRIPMPEELAWVEKGLRAAGQEKLADDFVTTMNRAAEQAVPVALDQFQNAINAMTLEDAQGILYGSEDAATQYFRKHSESELRSQFLPIVSETTASTGATSAYKDMTKQLSGGLSGLIDTNSLDLDEYVTDQALDGLFTMVAQEEARIREDPIARSSDLLEKVFGGN